MQPNMQPDVARFEDSPDLDGKRPAAGIALVGAYAGALALQLAAAVYRTAMRANATARPYTSLDKGVGRFFVMEMRG